MFKSELTDYLCLLTKYMRLKQKCLFQSVLMIAYFDPCFWSEILKNKLEAQNTIVLHYITNSFTRICTFVKKFSIAVSGHSLKRSTF